MPRFLVGSSSCVFGDCALIFLVDELGLQGFTGLECLCGLRMVNRPGQGTCVCAYASTSTAGGKWECAMFSERGRVLGDLAALKGPLALPVTSAGARTGCCVLCDGRVRSTALHCISSSNVDILRHHGAHHSRHTAGTPSSSHHDLDLQLYGCAPSSTGLT